MTQETPLPSDRTPAPAPQPRNPVVIVAVGILSVLLWLAVAVQLVIFVPKAERLFDEFKMKVPALTEWVIAYGRWHVPAIACFVLLACIGPG